MGAGPVGGRVTVERGDRWEMHLGDCLGVMAALPDAGADHVITDPPYEVESHTKARRALKDATQKRGRVNRGKVRRIDQPLDIDFGHIDETTRGRASLEFGRLTKRWTLVFCQIEAIAAWRQCLESAGLGWIRGGIWRKPDGAPQFTGDRPGQGFESIAIAHRPGRKRWNGGGKHAVWTCPLQHERGTGSAGQNEHPTVKPLALMLELVADFTDPHEIVLDPFAGSGTTGVACLRLGRWFVGIERDERYFRLACERLRAEESGSTLTARLAGQVPMFGGAR